MKHNVNYLSREIKSYPIIPGKNLFGSSPSPWALDMRAETCDNVSVTYFVKGAFLPAKSQKPKLLEQVRLAIRKLNYSFATEKAYTSWVIRYIQFHQKHHPAETATISELYRSFWAMRTLKPQ